MSACLLSRYSYLMAFGRSVENLCVTVVKFETSVWWFTARCLWLEFLWRHIEIQQILLWLCRILVVMVVATNAVLLRPFNHRMLDWYISQVSFVIRAYWVCECMREWTDIVCLVIFSLRSFLQSPLVPNDLLLL